MKFSLAIISLLISLTLTHSTDYHCNEADKAVLLQIKSHFHGVGLLSDWNPDDDCCDWAFIGCYPDDAPAHPGRVNALTVSGGTGLSGEIPDIIGNLPFLVEIMFFDEPKLTGPIPESVGKLKHLELIYLNSNNLSGPIPEFLGKLKNLREIDISDNRFTGSLPSLSLLPRLTKLNVSRNSFSGSVPNPPARLKSYDVSNNKFVGSLPTKLGQLKLDFVDVSYNRLCGPIPAGLNRFGATRFAHNKCLCGPPLPACK